MSFNKSLVDRLKKELKAQKDQELAEIFNVSPFVFSSWKRSKGKLIEEVVKYGVNNNLNFNNIFHNEEMKGEDNGVFVLMAEDLFSYYLNPREVISKLPKYNIPNINQSKIGFQVISQNMEPTLQVSSIVFGGEIDINKLRTKEIYVVSILNKGIFITRFKEQNDNLYVFENDNERFTGFSFTRNEIATIFKVNGVLAKL
ncbi:hypothetical protein [Myroides guanonis]|uniref:Bacteriophage CI repressor helix-turn-helix domain-containing protein n=1 Tax=Myroides guanonis TaxID=1150112 RepID=A0A1I3TID8_9FLAO|nr:hypothetical protein [Myroides guanonis]SFJ70302.1 hypothetical protein SAMN04487893_11384 [Myroides guanonis]